MPLQPSLRFTRKIVEERTASNCKKLHKTTSQLMHPRRNGCAKRKKEMPAVYLLNEASKIRKVLF